jgi:hypothetical protein
VRRDGNGSRPGEHHDEPREDRQVGVKAGPLQPLQRSAAERARSTPRTAARLVTYVEHYNRQRSHQRDDWVYAPYQVTVLFFRTTSTVVVGFWHAA